MSGTDRVGKASKMKKWELKKRARAIEGMKESKRRSENR